MKKVIIVLAVIVLSTLVIAQDAPKVEVFGGYAYTNVDTKDLAGRQSFNGWDADVAFHATKNVSIVGDFGGAYKSESASVSGFTGVGKLRLYNFLFGPRISASAGKVTPFAEALFGISRVTASADTTLGSGSTSSNGFGMALGGGLDVNANKHVAIRLAKFDYMLTRLKSTDLGITDTQSLNNFRIATGIVFKF